MELKNERLSCNRGHEDDYILVELEQATEELCNISISDASAIQHLDIAEVVLTEEQVVTLYNQLFAWLMRNKTKHLQEMK